MIAAVDLFISVVIFAAGFVGGLLGRRTPKPPKSAKPTSVTCDTCDHGRGFHTGGNGPCAAPIVHIDGIRLAQPTTCKCQAWDGPERPEDVVRGFQP